MNAVKVHVPPFNTTFAGMLAGAAQSLRIPLTDAEVFALSGHGFVINVHREICPSGPYCFNREPIYRLLRNLGIFMHDLGFFTSHSSREDRSEAENLMAAHLARGLPCAMVNMEWQLIVEQDATGFLTSQPWPRMDFPPGHLSFGDWKELGGEVHVNFFTLDHCEPLPAKERLKEVLRFAIAVHRDPASLGSNPDYGLGPDAFAHWRAALPSHGSEHGCWWNGTVWAECRAYVADWLKHLAVEGARDICDEAARHYQACANSLQMVADKEASLWFKLDRLGQAEEEEEKAVAALERLLRHLTLG